MRATIAQQVARGIASTVNGRSPSAVGACLPDRLPNGRDRRFRPDHSPHALTRSAHFTKRWPEQHDRLAGHRINGPGRALPVRGPHPRSDRRRRDRIEREVRAARNNQQPLARPRRRRLDKILRPRLEGRGNQMPIVVLRDAAREPLPSRLLVRHASTTRQWRSERILAVRRQQVRVPLEPVRFPRPPGRG